MRVAILANSPSSFVRPMAQGLERMLDQIGVEARIFQHGLRMLHRCSARAARQRFVDRLKREEIDWRSHQTDPDLDARSELVAGCTVAFFPNTPQWDANPYLSLLRQALRAQGVALAYLGSDFLSSRWLWAQRDSVDVLHFHWLHYHYLTAENEGSVVALLTFVRKLVTARLLGYRVVWTMHNVQPHERVARRLDLVARTAMVRLANAVIVLCEAGRAQLAQRFGRTRDVYTAPLGSYASAHPLRMTRAEARTRLDLDDHHFVYLYFGSVRPYKGVEQLLQIFHQLSDPAMLLCVVGAPHGVEIAQSVKAAADGDDRVILELSFVSDERLQTYAAACDVVVLPFTDVMSTSSAVAAMSMGRPVVVPALGCLPEWVTAECGILYDPTDADGLHQALLSAQERDLEAMGRAAYQRALSFSWDNVARGTLAAYLGMSGGH